MCRNYTKDSLAGLFIGRNPFFIGPLMLRHPFFLSGRGRWSILRKMWSLECCSSREAIVISHAAVMPAAGHAWGGVHAMKKNLGSPGEKPMFWGWPSCLIWVRLGDLFSFDLDRRIRVFRVFWGGPCRSTSRVAIPAEVGPWHSWKWKTCGGLGRCSELPWRLWGWKGAREMDIYYNELVVRALEPTIWILEQKESEWRSGGGGRGWVLSFFFLSPKRGIGFPSSKWWFC